MRPILSLFALAFALTARAVALIETYTEPWAEGNTYVLSVGTDAFGDDITKTLSQIGATGAATSTKTTKTTKTTDGRPTTTANRVVGQDTTAPPMQTTTYWYDPGDGVWTVGTWTATVTAAPAVPTAIVPEGTIQDYNTYQNGVNSAVLSSAAAAGLSSNSTGSSGATSIRPTGWAGSLWSGVLVGVLGVFASGWLL
ncbi:hypothetical protein M231_00162 [Tremella mesenterica]|uniref:Uncharacterized protein n=1 Tax=Tremella mesenterica TaxID=5217 RepID=A0A4Q1BWS6_TREME|nr:hypothetical protein M231_00162 [Tremella mesenterica]